MTEALDPLEDLLGGLRPSPRLQEDLARVRFQEAMFGATAPVRLGRYQLVERIGSGAMGSIYAAIDPRLGREVAIKLLHLEDPTSRAHDIKDEARALAKLAHPNVVSVYDVGLSDDEGALYIVMERLHGQTLAAWLRAESRAPEAILEAFAAAGRGLAAAHDAGLVHRDFKPHNVMVTDGGHVRVVDFGLAIEPSTRNAPAGTPAYMAPEQRRGEPLDGRADQYAFCVALEDALDGRLSSDSRHVLRRGRSPAKARRFATMDALLAALEQAQTPKRTPGRARRAVLMAAALAAIGVIAAAPGEPPKTRLEPSAAMRRVSSSATASAAIAAAGLALRDGDPREARRELERALGLARDDASQARATVQLVSVVGYHLHDTQAGLAYAKQAQALLERHPSWADLRASLSLHLANLEYARGRLDVAAAHLKASLALRERAARPGQDADLVSVLNNLGVVMTELDEPLEAIEVHRRALALVEDGDDDPLSRAGCLLNLGRAQRAAGQLPEATQTLERARQTFASAEDDALRVHPRLGFTLVALAQTQLEAGLPGEALAAATEAVEVLRVAYGDQHPQPALARLELARAMAALGREHEAQARAEGERALAALERTLGLDDANTRRAQAWLEAMQ